MPVLLEEVTFSGVSEFYDAGAAKRYLRERISSELKQKPDKDWQPSSTRDKSEPGTSNGMVDPESETEEPLPATDFNQ